LERVQNGLPNRARSWSNRSWSKLSVMVVFFVTTK
jgi:hypothetical protein